MAVQMQSGFILPQKFEKLRFTDFSSSVDSASTPSTPSTPSSPASAGYEIQIITPADKDDVIKFLRQFFFRDEPLNSSSKLIEGNETCPELEDFSMKDLDNKLNLKAVANGKIIGVCLNEILERGYIDNIEDEKCENEKFKKILDLLNYVSVKSDFFKQYPGIDKAMSVKILSVDGSWRGKGIAKNLMDKTRDMARQAGCGLMMAECSSAFTAKALKRLGFECCYSLNYADYKVDGKVVFKPDPPHDAITVYIQKI